MPETFDLKNFMSNCQRRVELKLEQCLESPDVISPTLNSAMRYSTLNGGKRIRPVLIYATLQALDADTHLGDAAACAVELVHAYSLIHDDLPAMDDDDLRRGRPTCHIAYDEATAILAGDALQTVAYQMIASNNPLSASLSAEARLKLVTELARASGTEGMAAGQALDLAAEGKGLELKELECIHRHKTGALIRACTRMAAISCNRDQPEILLPLDGYAEAIGLAFQVHDDILDVTTDTDILGKAQGADDQLAKATYPKILGLAGAQAMTEQLFEQAMGAISEFDEKADGLRALAKYVISRTF